MKVSYNRKSNVLLIWVSDATVDYAEEMGLFCHDVIFLFQTHLKP